MVFWPFYEKTEKNNLLFSGMLETVRFCRSPVIFFFLVSLFDHEWFLHQRWLRDAFNSRILEPNKEEKKKYFISNHDELIQVNDFLLFVSIAFQILYGTGELTNLFDPAVLFLPDLSHSRYPNQLYYQQASHHFSLPFLGIYRVMSD
jgi:hypothetical protein